MAGHRPPSPPPSPQEPPCVADTAPLREALFKVMAEGRGCGLVLGPARSLRGFLSEWDVGRGDCTPVLNTVPPLTPPLITAFLFFVRAILP